jgi:effector-binding domain-containing protein
MNPEIRERPEQPYVAIRCDITDGIRSAVDRAFPQLFGWLGERDVAPAGPPFIRYRELTGDGAPLVIEVGAPVAGPVTVGGDVHASALPAGRYAVLVHTGPYTHATEPDLTDAQERLAAWTEAQGLVHRHASARGWTLPCAVESFRTGPADEEDFGRWETELAYLVD